MFVKKNRREKQAKKMEIERGDLQVASGTEAAELKPNSPLEFDAKWRIGPNSPLCINFTLLKFKIYSFDEDKVFL